MVGWLVRYEDFPHGRYIHTEVHEDTVSQL